MRDIKITLTQYRQEFQAENIVTTEVCVDGNEGFESKDTTNNVFDTPQAKNGKTKSDEPPAPSPQSHNKIHTIAIVNITPNAKTCQKINEYLEEIMVVMSASKIFHPAFEALYISRA